MTGRRPFRGEQDLKGYEELDAIRLAQLEQRYGLNYVIVTRGHELAFGGRPLFTGQRFVVYALATSPRTGTSSLEPGSTSSPGI